LMTATAIPGMRRSVICVRSKRSSDSRSAPTDRAGVQRNPPAPTTAMIKDNPCARSEYDLFTVWALLLLIGIRRSRNAKGYPKEHGVRRAGPRAQLTHGEPSGRVNQPI